MLISSLCAKVASEVLNDLTLCPVWTFLTQSGHLCTRLAVNICRITAARCHSIVYIWYDTDLEQLSRLPYVRAILAESLRMYPQPPILIRRALNDDVLPTPLGGDPKGYPIGKGADIFISVWNLHRYSTHMCLMKGLTVQHRKHCSICTEDSIRTCCEHVGKYISSKV